MFSMDTLIMGSKTRIQWTESNSMRSIIKTLTSIWKRNRSVNCCLVSSMKSSSEYLWMEIHRKYRKWEMHFIDIVRVKGWCKVNRSITTIMTVNPNQTVYVFRSRMKVRNHLVNIWLKTQLWRNLKYDLDYYTTYIIIIIWIWVKQKWVKSNWSKW